MIFIRLSCVATLLACTLAPAPLFAQRREAVIVRAGTEPGTIEAGHWDGAFYLHSKLALAAWQIQQPSVRPSLTHLPDGRVLVFWPVRGSRVASIIAWDGTAMRETHAIPWLEGGAWLVKGDWPGGWRIAATLNANSDAYPDVLAYEVTGPTMDPTWSYRVVLGTADGGFDFESLPPVVISENAYACPMSAGDVNGDGIDDIAFHRYDTMNFFHTRMQFLAGNSKGGFDAPRDAATLFEVPFGSTEPVLIDLDGDGDMDFFLPPDDDNRDSGQCIIVYNEDGDGRYGKPVESIDLQPEVERSSGTVAGWARVGDQDGDGTLDLFIVTSRYDRGRDAREAHYHLYKGLGQGRFELAGLAHSHPYTLGEKPEALSWLGKRGVAPPAFPAPTAEDRALRAGLVGADHGPACKSLSVLLRMPMAERVRVLGVIPDDAGRSYAARALGVLGGDLGDSGAPVIAALRVLLDR